MSCKHPHSKGLTCTLPNVRPLNHSSASCSLAKGDLIHDSVLFDDCATLYAEAIPSCGVVFNDGTSAIRTYDLEGR
jgi:hypothetical protein